MEGHSGFAPKGEDIVCAAVSALAQTAVLGLKQQLIQAPKVHIEEGSLKCFVSASVSPGELEKAHIILTAIAAGLRAIAKIHPDYVKIKYKIDCG